MMEWVAQIAIAGVTLLLNAAVTYGAVKVSLRFLTDGVKEAKASSLRAHLRIDQLQRDMMMGHQ